MVLRVPRTVDDRLLLEDEPFRSYFAIRKLAIGCRSRGRSPLYVEIEKSMRETTNGVSIVFGTILARFLNADRLF